MTKLCGFFGSGAERDASAATVQAMAESMRHSQHAEAQYAWFDNGGMAVIGAGTAATNALALYEAGDGCMGVSGHVITGERTTQTAATLLRAYAARGDALLARLDGDFALAQYEAHSGTLTLAASMFGFCPLYYYADARGCWFASEVKAILAVLPQAALDWEAAADFFYIGHMLGARTLFKDIRELEPGQVVTYAEGRLARRSYADFTQAPVMASAEVSTAEIAERFTAAIERRRDESYADTVLLSGGMDSRLILGAQRRLGMLPHTITLEHANERGGADGRYACQIARQLGLECELRATRPDFYASPDCLEVFYILDGMAPTWELFISQVYAELDPAMGIVWEGMALGSGLGAAHQHGMDMRANMTDFLEKRALHRRLLRRILTPEAFQALDASFAQRLRAEYAQVPESENRYGYFVMKHRIRRRIAPNPHLLFASQVEARTPGTDRAFLEYVLAVPTHMRLHHRLYIQVVKKHFPELLAVPIISGGAPLPLEESLKTRLRRYASGPETQLKHALRRFNTKRLINSTFQRPMSREERDKAAMMDMVLSQTRFERPFYNTAQLQRWFDEYRGGNRLYHELFTLVFYIELWHQLFLERDSALRSSMASARQVVA